MDDDDDDASSSVAADYGTTVFLAPSHGDVLSSTLLLAQPESTALYLRPP